MTTTISGRQAYDRLFNSAAARWEQNTERFRTPLSLAEHGPKFELTSDDVFFCIGSCFARNIEEHLIYNSCKVLSKRIISPVAEWSARPNGFVNKFTTASMLNEIDWVIAPPPIDERLFERDPNGWVDRQLFTPIPVTLDRAKERRAYLLDDYFARMRKSSVIILTLGLIETWWDEASKRYLNAAPFSHSVDAEPNRYRLDITDAQQNLDTLERIRTGIKTLNASARMIVTVSPVPMNATFSGQDVLVANMMSKSTLRVAAGLFAERHPDVDYFPSYDMITMSPRASAYGQDCLHVSDRAVGEIIRRFLTLYIKEPPANVIFNELGYLIANPDVDAGVRSGFWESGFEHWMALGRSEGRNVTPKDGPTQMMVNAGAV